MPDNDLDHARHLVSQCNLEAITRAAEVTRLMGVEKGLREELAAAHADVEHWKAEYTKLCRAINMP